MSLSINLGITRCYGGQTGVQRLAALVQANTGALWDFSAAATLFESGDTSDPAEIGDPLRYVIESAAGGPTPVPWSQETIGFRPTRQAGYADFSGGNFMLGGANNLAIMRNAPVGVIGTSFRVSALPVPQTPVIGYRVAPNNNNRLAISLQATGALQLAARRGDDDSATVAATSAGVVSTDIDYTVVGVCNFVAGGAGAMVLYVNGLSAATQTLAGSGNSADTDSSECAIGGFSVSANFMPGRLVRAVAMKMAAAPTANQIAIINAGLAA